MRPRFLGIVTQHGIFYNSVIFLLLVDYASASKGGGRNDGRPHVHFTERISNGNQTHATISWENEWGNIRRATEASINCQKWTRESFSTHLQSIYLKKKSSIFVDASIHRFVCKILSAPRPFTIYSILRKFLRSCSRYPVLYGGMNCWVDNNSSAKNFEQNLLTLLKI